MRAIGRLGGVLLLVLCVGGIAAAGLLDSMNPTRPGDEPTVVGVIWMSSFVGFPIVGSLIIWKLPRHNMGWILGGIGASIAVVSACGEYATFALVTRDGRIPGGDIAAWVATWLVVVAVALVLQLLIYFPRGAPRNGFWRGVSRFVFAVSTIVGVIYAVRPGRLDAAPTVDNPLGIAGSRPVLDAILPVLANALVIVLLAAVVDKFLQYRSAGGEERQQLRWFALAGLGFPALFAISLIFEGIFGRNRFGDVDPVVIAFFLGFNGLAAGVGVAVFKYRLYDVGTIVNRTLVYGALTAVLAASYVGLVFVFQSVLASVTAESDLAIAASTLAVAALFRPVRTRLQAFIDGRFYRRKVDKQRTIEEFSAHIRDEVDLVSLSTQLERAVSETMQPAHVSLWLREAR